jgi:hypothetical protein
MAKNGRANWPEVGEIRTGDTAGPECYRALTDLGIQIHVNRRFLELIDPDPSDPLPPNCRLYALAHAELGMSQEEFDQCDDWNLLALLEHKLKSSEVQSSRKEEAPKLDAGRGGAPRGQMVNGESLKKLRGDMSQDALAETCRVAIDTIQRGERCARWSDHTFDRVADGLTMVHGRRITPDDLMKPQ